MDVEELISSIDIGEYIGQYVDLEYKNGELWGLSCFKDEKTPSFSVRPEAGFFYDYASGVGGNVWSFVKLYHHCSGRQAVEILQKYAGVDSNSLSSRGKLAATITAKKYQKKSSHQKDLSPKKSEILRENHMDRYSVDESKLKMWGSEGISMETLRGFGVKYDGFSNRLVYPIRDLDGNLVNVGGRTLDPDFKTKGLRKYTYFYGWPNGMRLIYGLYENLDACKAKKEIILFEGCKSVLLADTWGIKNTAAILTSHLNEWQMKILAKLGCRVVFGLDKDVDIRADKRIQQLSNYVNVDYIFDFNHLLDAKDAPVDKGKEVFEKLYNNRYKFR